MTGRRTYGPRRVPTEERPALWRFGTRLRAATRTADPAEVPKGAQRLRREATAWQLLGYPEARRVAAGLRRSAAIAEHNARVAAACCPYGDPLCPCPDGDPCHYEGPDPMTPPT